MKSRSNLLLVLSLAIATSIGCSKNSEYLGNYDGSRRARLEAELGTLNQERIRCESERARHETSVSAYLMDHKLASAALVAGAGGAVIAYDPDNELSDEVQAVGGITSAFAMIYAAANWNEVSEVANEITKASLVQTQYKQQLVNLDRQITVCKTQLQ